VLHRTVCAQLGYVEQYVHSWVTQNSTCTAGLCRTVCVQLGYI